MRHLIGTIIDPDAIAKRLNLANPRDVDLTAGKEAVKQIRQLINDKQKVVILENNELRVNELLNTTEINSN